MNIECEFCSTNMEDFVSDNEKHIYMCPYCGCLYLPNDTRNYNVREYECSYGNFIKSNCYNLPTQKQMSYLKYLVKELNYEIDLTKITKFDAALLITELKEKFDKSPKKYSSVCDIKTHDTYNAIDYNVMDEEHAMNHSFGT